MQFECPEHAENARAVLTNCPLWGRNVSVSTSKHLTVQANRSDLEDDSSKLFGDYTNSPLHRYGGAAARNVPSIEPSRLLHISNIPLIMEESSLRALFEDHFGPVSKFKFITNSNREGQPSERKMALIELPTVQVPRSPPRGLRPMHHPVRPPASGDAPGAPALPRVPALTPEAHAWQDAAEAICALHGTVTPQGLRLRVSFSTSNLA